MSKRGLSVVVGARERAVEYGASQWDRLAREEAAERRRRGHRKAAATRRLDRPRSGRVVTEIKVRPEVMKVALKVAHGDASRLRIVSATEVWVH